MAESSEQSEVSHNEKPGEKPSEKPEEEDDDEEDLFGGDDDDDEPTPKPPAASPSPAPAPAASEKTNVLEAPVSPKDNETGGGDGATESSPAKSPTKAQSSVSAPIPRLGNKSTTTPEKTTAGPGSSSIPRLGHKTAPDRSNAGKGSRNNNNNSGNARSSGPPPSLFGLPEGVHIPGSVHSGLLQGKLLDTLRGLPVQLINDALCEYDDAVQIKGGAIRNHGAYLYGVIKRYVSVQERAQAGEGKGILPMGPELTPAVNSRLQKLVIDKFCTEEEMNEKVKSKIRMLSEKDALFAIDELASVERRQIRNFGSYFMGILNRYMRGDKKQDDKKRENRHGRFDNRRRDDQYHPRGRDNNPNDSYRRDRSRDRYDQDRRRDSNDWRNQYDPRRANPSYHGQNQPPPPPPMGGLPGNPPPPPPRNNPPGIVGNNQYSLQQPQQQRMMQPPNQNMYGQPQPPPPPQMDQSRFVPQSGGPPPASSPYGPQPTHHTPQQGPGGIGSQFNSQAVVPPPYGNPQTGMGNPQAFRGKPPSNSYGVQMNQPHMGGQQPPQSYTNNRFSQPPPPSNNAAPGGWQNNPQGGPQNSHHQGQLNIPVDILGLADKAASAVQALQSQSQLQMPPGLPPSMRQPGTNPQQMHHQGMPLQMSMPPQPYSSMPGQQQVPKQNQSMAARRRTTAQISELPVTVQYAIQHLQATGQIDGNLDEGILGMVKDLPESLALTAIQKFSTIDQSTMRNKTAYLAGVLRRELEKINRR